jgi:hypothetical protein
MFNSVWELINLTGDDKLDIYGKLFRNIFSSYYERCPDYSNIIILILFEMFSIYEKMGRNEFIMCYRTLGELIKNEIYKYVRYLFHLVFCC